jgi:hypothetical protein
MAAIIDRDTDKKKSLIENNLGLNINWFSRDGDGVSILTRAISVAIRDDNSEIVRIIFEVLGIKMRESGDQILP